jgi:hypothetical protein
MKQVLTLVGTARLASGSSREIVRLRQTVPIPSTTLPSFPPGLPPLPLPSVPSLAAPDFSLKFNRTKYDTGSDDGEPFRFPHTSIKPPSINPGLSLPSFPPGLPGIPLPSVPSISAPDFSLKFNRTKYDTGSDDGEPFRFPHVSVKPPSIDPGLSLPAFPPGLPSVPVLPSLPVPSLALSDLDPYLKMKLKYDNLPDPAVSFVPELSVES